MKQYTLWLILALSSTTLFAQDKPSKWNLTFDILDESLILNKELRTPERFGHSRFRGWSLGLHRDIFSTRNFDLSAGLEYSYRRHVVTRQSSLLSRRALPSGVRAHYLAIPVTLRPKTKGRVTPQLQVSAGTMIYEQTGHPHTSAFFRPPGVDFLSLKPSVDVRISKHISLSLGANFTAHNMFNYRTTKWSFGPQIGLRIKF